MTTGHETTENLSSPDAISSAARELCTLDGMIDAALIAKIAAMPVVK
jgi:hypothetical protein